MEKLDSEMTVKISYNMGGVVTEKTIDLTKVDDFDFLDEYDSYEVLAYSEDLPGSLFSKNEIDSKLWDFILLDSDKQEIILEYETLDSRACSYMELSDIIESYQGTYESWGQMAKQLLEDEGILERLDEVCPNISNAIDFQEYGSDYAYDYSMTDNGFVFSNN